MARYTGADCRRCRREKTKLYLKGAKCDSPKCPIELRPYPPGVHGRARTKDSEYLLQMREKQKAARIYGVLEKQFRGYFKDLVIDLHVRGELHDFLDCAFANKDVLVLVVFHDHRHALALEVER